MKYIYLLLFPILLYSSAFTHKMSYFEDTQKLDFSDVKTKKFINFEDNSLFKGYNFNTIWVKVKFENNSSKNIKRILSLKNPTIDYIDFYENDKLKTSTGDHRKNLNKELLDIYFSFHINIDKMSKKTYYLKMKTVNAFIINIDIQKEKTYLQSIEKQKMFLLFFLGFVLSIIIYNLFLLFIVQERVYFYYVMFQMSTLLLLLSLSGLGYYLIWKDNFVLNEITIMSFDDLSLIFALLFTKSFLDVKKQFPKLNILIYIMLSFLVYVMITPWQYHSLIVKPVMIGTLFSIFSISLYAVYKRVYGARLFFFSWLVLMFGSFLTLFKSFGLLEVNFLTTWSLYLGSIIEAVLFSIALAYRIKKLKEDKTEALKISKDRLDKKVKEKTVVLTSLVKQKEVLIKEINHRVKNNLQIISSFITILSLKEKNSIVQNDYNSLNSKIGAIASLHEFFYKQKNSNEVDVKDYLLSLKGNLDYLQPQGKKIVYELNICKANFDLNNLTIIGLVLNELITNSMQHAFTILDIGTIKISLSKKEDAFVLIYEDDGVGFDINRVKSSSLGLKLVNKLATKQLNAQMQFESKKGSCFTFNFKK